MIEVSSITDETIAFLELLYMFFSFVSKIIFVFSRFSLAVSNQVSAVSRFVLLIFLTSSNQVTIQLFQIIA
ncbi:hypothetical protein GW891_00980 [bacterium]|nr:hypothetical protein [bacterium]